MIGSARTGALNPYLLAACSGVLYVLAFPGFELWPLSLVAFVPVLHVLSGPRPLELRQAAAVGVLFGAVTQLFGFSWLAATLRAFSSLSTPACVLVYVLICGLHAGAQCAFVLCLWAARRRGRNPLLLAPFAYAGIELAYPMLFPNYFAASLHPVPRLLQLADIGGPSLVTGLLVACNAVVYGTLRGAIVDRRVPWRELSIGVALAASATSYGLLRERELDRRIARAPKLSVGIVQANMERLDKREARAEGRLRHIEQSERLERGYLRPAHGTRAPDLIVWPETALQYVLSTELKTARPLLGSLTTPVLFGGLGHRVRDGHAELYNSAFLTDGDAKVLGRSDKLRLIPFAEYIPFGDRFPVLYDWLPNSGAFEPGASPRALTLRGHRIATLICYEDILPALVREVVSETDAELLVNMTNDAWFGRSREPAIHFALSKLRAVEQRRYLVRANNSGISGVIDPLGRVVSASQPFTRATLRAEVAWLAGPTPYRTLGDWAGWLGLTLALLAALLPANVFGRARQ